MPTDEDKLRDGFDTVPPPAGEEAPYGAPTMVARVPDTVLDELRKARGEPTNQPAPSRAEPAARAKEPARPRSQPAPPRNEPVPASTRNQPPMPASTRNQPAPAPPRNQPAAPRNPPAPPRNQPASARNEPAPASRRNEPAPADAGANDLSALADAASHVVMPQRPKTPAARPPVPAGAAPLSQRGAPTASGLNAATVPTPFAPMLPSKVKGTDLPHVPFGIDEPAESSRAPGDASVPLQSGRTVPLSSALLASVIKSVEDKRAAAAAAAPAPAPVSLPVAAPAQKRRTVFALVFIFGLGLTVFIIGVVMFLDALK